MESAVTLADQLPPPKRTRRNQPTEASSTDVAAIVPKLVDLKLVGQRFDPPRSTHSLVVASSGGTFVKVKRVGNRWYAWDSDLVAFFATGDAKAPTPAQVKAVRQAGAASPEQRLRMQEDRARRRADRARSLPSAQPGAGTSASS